MYLKDKILNLKDLVKVTGWVLMVLAPVHVKAQDTFDAIAFAALPPYCKYTQGFRDKVPGGNDVEKIKYWYSIMGGSYPNGGVFHHMHHYCEGLLASNHARFKARTPQARQSSFNWSIKQYDYVLNSAGDFALRPEILTEKGKSLIALGQGPQAVREFEDIIKLKPDYWPPYAELGNYFKAKGDLKQAREWLERGVAAIPDATALTRRLAELDAAKGKSKASSELSRKPAVPKQSTQETIPQSVQQTETPQPPAKR